MKGITMTNRQTQTENPTCPISCLMIPKYGERTIYLANGEGGYTLVDIDALNTRLIEFGLPAITMPRRAREYDFIAYLAKEISSLEKLNEIRPFLKRLEIAFHVS